MGLLQVLKLSESPGPGVQAAPAKDGAEGKTAVPGPKADKLSQAAASWRRTHGQASERISALKASVKTHYGNEHPALLRQIEIGLAKLDGVLDKVGHHLADSLAHAGEADGDGARKAELDNARSILTEYIKCVKSEPLVAHIDQNPFGVKTDLRVLLAAGLTDAAKAIG